MPKKKNEIDIPGNISSKEELNKKVISSMKSADCYIFVSVKGQKAQGAQCVDGASPEQLVGLSRELGKERMALLNLVSDALKKHNEENLGKIAPRGVS